MVEMQEQQRTLLEINRFFQVLHQSAVTFKLYISHISALYQPHLSHISATSQPYISHISSIFQAHPSHIPATSQTLLTICHSHKIATYQPHLSHIPATYQPHFSHILPLRNISPHRNVISFQFFLQAKLNLHKIHSCAAWTKQ